MPHSSVPRPLWRTASGTALAVLVLLGGCDNADPAGDAPALVASSAFAFDDSFPEADAAFQGDVGLNWINGAARVGLVSLAVGVHLVIPAAATDAADGAEPYVEDGTWIWESVAAGEGNRLTFRLEGTPEGREVDWRMLLSSDEPLNGEVYDDFELYTATTALDGRTGSWRLFYNIEGARTEVLAAAFDVTSETEAEITFSVPETNPEADARGSSVRYASDGDDRLFDWRQEVEDVDALVEWSEATHAGSITATDYNDGQRACWDENLDDATCAE